MRIETDAECVAGEINKLVFKFGLEKHLRWLLTCKKYIIKSLKVAAALKTSSEGFIEERINSELATLKSGKQGKAKPNFENKHSHHEMYSVQHWKANEFECNFSPQLCKQLWRKNGEHFAHV